MTAHSEGAAPKAVQQDTTPLAPTTISAALPEAILTNTLD
jgi:hypothetical protein